MAEAKVFLVSQGRTDVTLNNYFTLFSNIFFKKAFFLAEMFQLTFLHQFLLHHKLPNTSYNFLLRKIISLSIYHSIKNCFLKITFNALFVEASISQVRGSVKSNLKFMFNWVSRSYLTNEKLWAFRKNAEDDLQWHKANKNVEMNRELFKQI